MDERTPGAPAPRRTLAIISHPDAGKTTMTEALLYLSGAVREAGEVTGKAGARHATSDWMSLEQQRGISISSAAVQFEIDGHVVNLLDTPGHQDFSEDTYRTLTAADSAVMLLDAARGVQPQTEKLFQVCRRRGTPVLTLINKMDRPARDPFQLLDEVERVLGIAAAPVTWPVGDGPRFRGVFDRLTRRFHPFDRERRRLHPDPVETTGADDPRLADHLEPDERARLVDEVGLLDGLLPAPDRDAFIAGLQTPAFFGSVLTNLGVDVFMRHFLGLAPPPGPLVTNHGPVPPDAATFTAFVFKVQANLDRQHRDRTAFARITTGRFERGMHAVQTRTGRSIKLARAATMFGRERATVEEAYPGDVVGLVVPSQLRIGDLLSSDPDLRIADLPRFAPEAFVTVRARHTDRSKGFRKGLAELAEEGVVQVFLPAQGARDPILGAVGALQFEVFEHRMREEYAVEIEMTREPHTVIRWFDREVRPTTRFVKLARDTDGQPVGLFVHEREIKYFAEEHPDVQLRPFPAAGDVVRI